MTDLDRWRQIAQKHLSPDWPSASVWSLDEVVAAIAEAVAEETERCAKIAENTPTALLPSGQFLSERVAAAIRQTESPPKET